MYHLWLTWLAVTVLSIYGCGNAGKKEATEQAFSGVPIDLLGSIRSSFGGQSDMSGWIVILQERDTNIARVAQVDTAGIFGFRHVFVDRPQTLGLANQNFRFSAVTSIPSGIEGTIAQYFTITGDYIPHLINKARVLNFEEMNGIVPTNNLAADQDLDGNPDGIAALGLVGGGFNLQSVDIDGDGLPNDNDSDINGDGIPNIFDPDSDGDGLANFIDPDANGNLIIDTAGDRTDQHFREGIDWLAVQFVQQPQADGTEQTSMTITTKVREIANPHFVQVRGRADLFNAATVLVTDETGARVPQAWDLRLMDDGLSEDGAAGDTLFARRIFFNAGARVRGQEVIFVQLAFGDPADPWFMEFPYVFPNIVPEAITAEYEPNTRSILLSGNPFGQIQDFTWAASIYDAATGARIYNTASTPGNQRTVVLPDNVLDPNVSYQFSLVAQVVEAISGYSPYTVYSPVLPLAAPAAAAE